MTLNNARKAADLSKPLLESKLKKLWKATFSFFLDLVWIKIQHIATFLKAINSTKISLYQEFLSLNNLEE